MYSKITTKIAEELADICGEKNVIYNNPDGLFPYSHDEIPGEKYRRMPKFR